MRNPQAYELDGQTVYELLEDDFGAAEIDSHDTGIKHLSVTANPDGSYPGFTVPVMDLQALNQETEDRRRYLCAGQHASDCLIT